MCFSCSQKFPVILFTIPKYSQKFQGLGLSIICIAWNNLEFLGIPRLLGIYFARVYGGECVSYSLEYFQNFLNFKRSLVLKTQWADKFYYCFKVRAIYTFYSCSSAVSNRCHIFKTCLQSRAIFALGSNLH